MNEIILPDGSKLIVPNGAQVSTAPGFIGSMSAIVNGAAADRISTPVGQPVTVRVECSMPITDTFNVPLVGLFGAPGKTLAFNFVDGVAERAVTFTASGEWEATEDSINLHLPPGQKFRFAGLKISVSE